MKTTKAKLTGSAKGRALNLNESALQIVGVNARVRAPKLTGLNELLSLWLEMRTECLKVN